MTSGGGNVNEFPGNQLTIYIALYCITEIRAV